MSKLTVSKKRLQEPFRKHPRSSTGRVVEDGEDLLGYFGAAAW